MKNHIRYDKNSRMYICTCGYFSMTEHEHNTHVVGHQRKSISKLNLSDEYYEKYYGVSKNV